MSCEVERFPYDSIASEELLSGEGGIAAATLGNYAILKGDADGNGFASQFHRIAEYPGDNVALSGTTTDALFFTYNYNNLATSGRVNNFWTSGYQAIVGCNKMIALTTEGESEETDQLIGENYYLRAYAYFELVNVFGRPYNQGRDNLGVPLKLSSQIDDLPDRNTVGEVYDQVLADLLKAESLMSVNKSNSYATKEAAQALLSRVYLYMEENQKSIEYANKVISSGRYNLLSTDQLPDYTRLNPDDNPETIFCFKFLEESDYNHGYYTVGSLYANILGSGWGEMYASSDFLNLLRKNPSDKRLEFIDPQYLTDDNGDRIPVVYWINENYQYVFKRTFEQGGKTYFSDNGTDYLVSDEENGSQTLYFYTTTSGSKQYVIKDYDMVKRNGYPKFFILKCSLQDDVPQLWSPVVSRLAEMYLNRAEAYAKLNQVGNALDDVNVIRTRAGIAAYDDVSNFPDGMNILDVVLQERRMELAYEGHRKFDVFRNGRTMNRRYPGTHLNGNNPRFEIPASANRVIEYIPEAQINVQPSLIQND
ncbi:MAG: RagB/SusD family nutrient uptake outer membrane protein [Zunongwangia sp.]|uniref:RagB/SusD family protein n=2 Tax=Zunongwangia profunda TaxID=398743 RepID=D5BGN6_ZUNPS|nr:ragB/SusD family protein [Zunongwangia profunda SM-A87]MAO35943.1 RagB/SusD family nutrient uptake outer membrane protein [Zunongwangia sp.]MAS69498.1 RagB/SusD family nutrient uptake outer membrane protein [Zunongwangia sp.]|tara:strand:- start:4354 stop:5961 length:1608 start_codon:yes stop_codon:yes gene_type:complete